MQVMLEPSFRGHISRFRWHCEICQGDSLFDVNPQGFAGPKELACLGCGDIFPLYLDAGIIQRYFRGRGVGEWKEIPGPSASRQSAS